jgi:hypothetical protein
MTGEQRLVLIAHKCRGEAVLEIALEWQFGTPSDPAPWYMLQSTGNRIYPYWVSPLPNISYPPLPAGHRDFWDPRKEPAKAAKEPKAKQPASVMDLL